jgi:hypothetical protein
MTAPIDRERHVRAMMLPEFGEPGQRAVQAGELTVEAEGLAAEIARSYLEAAGARVRLVASGPEDNAARDPMGDPLEALSARAVLAGARHAQRALLGAIGRLGAPSR